MSRQLRGLILVGLLAVAACAPSGSSPSSFVAPTTTVPGLAVPTTGTVPPASETVPRAATTTVGSVPLATAEEIAALLPSTPVTTAPPGVVRVGILERQEFKLECMRSFGFDGEIQEKSLAILSDVPPEQFDRYMEVGEICRRRLFAKLGVPEKKTEEDLLKDYSALLYVRECMLAEGYPVDDPPSPEVFVETYGAIWHPYTGVMLGTQEPIAYYTRLEEICPADLFYLFDVLGLEYGP